MARDRAKDTESRRRCSRAHACVNGGLRELVALERGGQLVAHVLHLRRGHRRISGRMIPRCWARSLRGSCGRSASVR